VVVSSTEVGRGYRYIRYNITDGATSSVESVDINSLRTVAMPKFFTQLVIDGATWNGDSVTYELQTSPPVDGLTDQVSTANDIFDYIAGIYPTPVTPFDDADSFYKDGTRVATGDFDLDGNKIDNVKGIVLQKDTSADLATLLADSEEGELRWWVP